MIIAFVFARRLQTIIDKIISNEKSAYIKGRFIGINARLVLDIYDNCMENNSEGLLLFLDFKKPSILSNGIFSSKFSKNSILEMTSSGGLKFFTINRYAE